MATNYCAFVSPVPIPGISSAHLMCGVETTTSYSFNESKRDLLKGDFVEFEHNEGDDVFTKNSTV